MKKWILNICLLLSLLGCSTILFAGTTPAAQSSSPELTLLVNGLKYMPRHTPFLQDNLLYLSCEDLAEMTYGTFTSTPDQLSLAIQNNTFNYDLKTQAYTYNHLTFYPIHKLYLSSDQIPYLPIIILDKFDYPYEYSNGQLSITPAVPYSTSTDTYSSHHLYETDYKTYEELLSPLMSAEEASKLVANSKQKNSYISFITTENKANCMEQIKRIDPPSSIQLYVRQLNTAGDAPALSSFQVYPVTYRIKDNSLLIKMGDTDLSCSCFWSTYNPILDKVSVDLHKSLDVMLMRTFYEYFRNTYNLKDNKAICPYAQITYGRSDYMNFDVYLDSDPAQKAYRAVIYKQSCAKSISYYIDLLPAK